MAEADLKLNSIPDLFLLFGCGAAFILLYALTLHVEAAWSLLNLLGRASSNSSSLGLILAPMLIFLCYILGATMALLGEVILALVDTKAFEKRYNILIWALMESDQKYYQFVEIETKKLLPYTVGVGFGALLFILQVGTFLADRNQYSFPLLLISLSATFLSFVGWRWRTHISMQMLEHVQSGGSSAVNSASLIK